jgi:hypothetical protein
MKIAELKALMPLIREFEATENRLALLREYKGDFLVVPVEPPLPHDRARADNSHLMFRNDEVIDLVIDLLEQRLERLRAALRAAGVE